MERENEIVKHLMSMVIIYHINIATSSQFYEQIVNKLKIQSANTKRRVYGAKLAIFIEY